MRGSLDKRYVPATKWLDEKLKRSATEAFIVPSKVREANLEDFRLFYDIPTLVELRAPGSEERAEDPHEGFVPIYEPAMQQSLHLPIHLFFRKVLRDWNLALCHIMSNSRDQIVVAFLLWRISEAGKDLTPRKF
ncbi:Uncharacterized protein Adt_03134 [Abeliophyllum distichum]|uniref:Uncharacterized protein n=1 Tax=Abeliophyllum distichum TaxID=126358 RepID=A0ABD1VXS5_9LAMI